MAKFMTTLDLAHYAKGTAFLGSGGGGNPAYGCMIAKNQLDLFGPVPLISVESLLDDDLIVPLEFMGAPLVGREKLPSSNQLEQLVACIETIYQKSITAFCVAEIGGANALVPFYIAGRLGKPVVDGDLIGRAFPELQMISTNVLGISSSRAFLADAMGNTMILNCPDFNLIERYARQLTIAFGSRAACSLQVLTGVQAKKGLIRNTISRAIHIGNLLSKSAQTLDLELMLEKLDGQYIGTGIVTDINQSIENGFLQGTVTISGKNNTWNIDLQNEYLFVREDNQLHAQTPDIITLLETETRTPITSESLFFGARLHIISAKSPDLWYSPEGLKIVGPDAFRSQS